MSQWHNTTSTGYETPASMDVTATRENNAIHYDISSGDVVSGQHSTSSKNFASDDAAPFSNEKTTGTSSWPQQGSVQGVSRARSRSSRTKSNESSADEVHGVKRATADQPPGCVGKTMRPDGAGKQKVINSCDPRMQHGVTGLPAPHQMQWNEGVPMQKLISLGSDGKTLPTAPLAPLDIRSTVPN